MSSRSTDLDQLSIDELVKYVSKQIGMPILSVDEEIMQKSFITGYSLVHYNTNEDLKEKGSSWGTRSLLLKLRDDFLGRKRRKR